MYKSKVLKKKFKDIVIGGISFETMHQPWYQDIVIGLDETVEASEDRFYIVHHSDM